MLLVTHYIAKSEIHGLGVFAAQKIKKGERVWEFNPIIDREISEDSLAGLPAHVVVNIRTHAEFIPESGCYVLAGDGDYFMNHSDRPSFVDDGRTMYAARDIEIGEELTCDYRVVIVHGFDPDSGLPRDENAEAGWSDRTLKVVARSASAG